MKTITPSLVKIAISLALTIAAFPSTSVAQTGTEAEDKSVLFCNQGDNNLRIAYFSLMSTHYDFPKLNFEMALSGWHTVSPNDCHQWDAGSAYGLEVFEVEVAVVYSDANGEIQLAPYAGVDRNDDNGFGVLRTSLDNDPASSEPEAEHCIPAGMKSFDRETRLTTELDFEDPAGHKIDRALKESREELTRCRSDEQIKIPFALDMDLERARRNNECDVAWFRVNVTTDRIVSVRAQGENMHACD